MYRYVKTKIIYLSFSNEVFYLIEIASSVGEITKASVNAPCTKEYCTFYKGTDARLEFTFLLSKIIQIKKNTRIFFFE
jgi:hypothetical protein